MPKPAQTVEFTPDTIVIDGAPLPWPISDDYSVRYLPFSYAAGVTGLCRSRSSPTAWP